MSESKISELDLLEGELLNNGRSKISVLLEKQILDHINNVSDKDETFSKKVTFSNKNKFEFRIVAVLNGFSTQDFLEELVKDLGDWFNNLDFSFYEDYESLHEAFVGRLRLINKETIERKYTKTKATFAGMIIAKDKTIIASVGDEKIYILHDKKIEILENGDSKNKRYFGSDADVYVSSIVLSNDDYVTLMIYNKGDEEHIADDEAKIIGRKTDRDKLAIELLESLER